MSSVNRYLKAQCDDLREILATGRDLRLALASGDADGASRAVGRRWGILDRMAVRERSAPHPTSTTSLSATSVAELRDLGDELDVLARAVLTEDRYLMAHVDHRRRRPLPRVPAALLPN